MPCEGHEKLVAYCGLYCGDCFFYKGEIADLAKQLRKKLREAKLTKNYVEFAKFAKEFKDFPKCYDVLAAMMKMRCGGCREGGGPPFCRIRKCCLRRGFEGCWECSEYETCRKLDFLRPTHTTCPHKEPEEDQKAGLRGVSKRKEILVA